MVDEHLWNVLEVVKWLIRVANRCLFKECPDRVKLTASLNLFLYVGQLDRERQLFVVGLIRAFWSSLILSLLHVLVNSGLILLLFLSLLRLVLDHIEELSDSFVLYLLIIVLLFADVSDKLGWRVA